MSNYFEITRKIVLNKIKKGENFSLSELEQEINTENAVMRIGPNYTVKEFLTDLKREDVLDYDNKSKKYIVRDKNYNPF